MSKEQDDFSSSRRPALAYCGSMIFSENRFPLFGIMLRQDGTSLRVAGSIAGGRALLCRSYDMRMTRRELGAIATGFIITLAAIGFRRDVFGLVQSAAADEPSNGDLMVAGPLGEKAQGKADAPVTVIEYASMTCPHCANFALNVYPVLKSRYIDTGQVRYILREFPLDPLAAAGFMLARCAGDDKYFTIVDLLFRTQHDWVVQKPLAPLLGIAEQEGFSKESFDACLANQRVLDGIEWVRQRAATKFGVDSTPTFFINGEIHRGDMTVAELEQALRSAPKNAPKNALKSKPETGG